MKPGHETDQVLPAFMQECIERIRGYARGDRTVFMGSRLVHGLAQAIERMRSNTPDDSNTRLSTPPCPKSS